MEYFSNVKMVLDIEGTPLLTIPAGETRHMDIVFTANKLLTGVEYFKDGGNFLDKLDISFIAPNGVEIAKRATGVNLSTHGRYDFYASQAPQGYSLRLTFKNNGPNETRLLANLLFYKDV